MYKLINTQFVVLLITLITTTACSHFQAANEFNIRKPTSLEEGEEILKSEQANNQNIKGLVEEKNSRRLSQLFLATRVAQSLVSSFDLRAQEIKSTGAFDELMRSRLYCKIQKVRQLHHVVEERLEDIFKYSQTSQEYSNWFSEKLGEFRDTNIANEAAIGNFILNLENKKSELCPAKTNCVVNMVESLPAQRYNIFNHRDFKEFMDQNILSIARYGKPSDTDLEPGECFQEQRQGTGRTPDAISFDWQKKHWIRSNLKNGEFVITYDDGPHGSYTEPIATLWKKSKLARPTFFWLSKNVKRYKTIAQKTLRSGFYIGSHSYSHADHGNLVRANSFSKLNPFNRRLFKDQKAEADRNFNRWRNKTLDQQIMTSSKNIASVMREVDPSYQLKYFRLPFGSGVKKKAIGDRFVKIDVDHFFWKVDSLDWQDKNPVSIHSRVTGQMKTSKRGLILFHDIQKQTIKATSMLIDTFKSTRKWNAVPITRMRP